MKKYNMILLVCLLVLVNCKSAENNEEKESVAKNEKTAQQETPKSLLDIYQRGAVQLVADTTYGAKNNWDELFDRYNDTISTYARPASKEKEMVLAPDGSIFLSHHNRHDVYKFDPNGNFELMFGEGGGKYYNFPMMPHVQTILDDTLLLVNDVNSRLQLFDFEGNFIEMKTLKYMSGVTGVGNGKLLVSGSALWAKKWRRIVLLLDWETGEEKVIYEYFTPRNKPGSSVTFKKKGGKGIMIQHYINPKVEKDSLIYMVAKEINPSTILFLSKGGFIVGNRTSGKIEYFDSFGKLLNSFVLDIERIKLSQEDALEKYNSVKEYSANTLAHFKTFDDPENEGLQRAIRDLETADYDRYKDINNYYPYLPYYSNMMVDGDGNLLVFEFTKKEVTTNKFNIVAFNTDGKVIARTQFICPNYDLHFNEDKFIIANGYVYALAEEKEVDGVPLRLVRFKMEN